MPREGSHLPQPLRASQASSGWWARRPREGGLPKENLAGSLGEMVCGLDKETAVRRVKSKKVCVLRVQLSCKCRTRVCVEPCLRWELVPGFCEVRLGPRPHRPALAQHADADTCHCHALGHRELVGPVGPEAACALEVLCQFCQQGMLPNSRGCATAPAALPMSPALQQASSPGDGGG